MAHRAAGREPHAYRDRARADLARPLDRSIAIPSSVIRAFDYDPVAHRLDVQFVNGRRYSYLDVPEPVVLAMRRAASQGGFFNRRIRDNYRFVRR